MNTKIKILAILLGSIYFIIVLHSVLVERNYFMGEPMSKKWYKEYYYTKVEPKAGERTFIEQLTNNKTGQTISADIDRFIMDIPSAELGLSISTKGLKDFLWSICSFLSPMILIIPFALGVDIFKGARKGITKGTVLSLRAYGWVIIGYFLLDLGNIWLKASIMHSYVDLEHYKIIQPFPQYFLLMLAVILLILAEVFKESIRMKEEVDLTI